MITQFFNKGICSVCGEEGESLAKYAEFDEQRNLGPYKLYCFRCYDQRIQKRMGVFEEVSLPEKIEIPSITFNHCEAVRLTMNRATEKARQEEREACAKICREGSDLAKLIGDTTAWRALETAADRILARGKEKPRPCHRGRGSKS